MQKAHQELQVFPLGPQTKTIIFSKINQEFLETKTLTCLYGEVECLSTNLDQPTETYPLAQINLALL